jgi:hypothetical protein
MAVAVVVDKSAAGAPGFARACDAGFFADVGEGAVAIVVIEDILAVVGYVQILEAVVIVIADADALAPAAVREAGFLGDIGKRAVVIVAVEMIGGSVLYVYGRAFELCTVDDEDVGPTVVVVIEDGDAGAGGFDDVLLCVAAAEDVRHRDARFFGDVEKLRQRGCGFGGRLLREGEAAQAKQDQQCSGERSENSACPGLWAEWHALTEILGCTPAGQGAGAACEEIGRLRIL